jgi:hypothetical protein
MSTSDEAAREAFGKAIVDAVDRVEREAKLIIQFCPGFYVPTHGYLDAIKELRALIGPLPPND